MKGGSWLYANKLFRIHLTVLVTLWSITPEDACFTGRDNFSRIFYIISISYPTLRLHLCKLNYFVYVLTIITLFSWFIVVISKIIVIITDKKKSQLMVSTEWYCSFSVRLIWQCSLTTNVKKNYISTQKIEIKWFCQKRTARYTIKMKHIWLMLSIKT